MAFRLACFLLTFIPGQQMTKTPVLATFCSLCTPTLQHHHTRLVCHTCTQVVAATQEHASQDEDMEIYWFNLFSLHGNCLWELFVTKNKKIGCVLIVCNCFLALFFCQLVWIPSPKSQIWWWNDGKTWKFADSTYSAFMAIVFGNFLWQRTNNWLCSHCLTTVFLCSSFANLFEFLLQNHRFGDEMMAKHGNLLIQLAQPSWQSSLGTFCDKEQENWLFSCCLKTVFLFSSFANLFEFLL